MSNFTGRILGLVIIVVALISMQTGAARAQSSDFSAASKTAGATAALYGAGAVACTALTAGGCGVGLAVAGATMGAIGVAISMFPTPNDPINWRTGSPSQMPDFGFGDGMMGGLDQYGCDPDGDLGGCGELE